MAASDNEVLREDILVLTPPDLSKFKRTLSVAYVLGDEREYFKESLQSIERIADEIIIVLDSKTNDGTDKFVADLATNLLRDRLFVYYKQWNFGAEQKDYLLKRCTKDWILFMDGDEILSDNAIKLREYIDNADEETDAFKIQGHHFIYNLSWEDATIPEHFWEARLIKNTKDVKYEGLNHAILTGYNRQTQKEIRDVKIFHMGYIEHLDKIMTKYNTDIKYRQIHNTDFVEMWKFAHIFGHYPLKPFIDEYPSAIKQKFKFIDSKYPKVLVNKENKDGNKT